MATPGVPGSSRDEFRVNSAYNQEAAWLGLSPLRLYSEVRSSLRKFRLRPRLTPCVRELLSRSL